MRCRNDDSGHGIELVAFVPMEIQATDVPSGTKSPVSVRIDASAAQQITFKMVDRVPILDLLNWDWTWSTSDLR